MAPLLKVSPLGVFLGLGIVHLLCLPFIAMLPPQPRPHGMAAVEDAVGEAALAKRFLHSFRGLLFVSYVLVSLLIPRMPERFTEFHLDVAWHTPLAAVWTITRLGTFILLERWHGWHGRLRTPVWSTATLLIGSALAYFGGGPITIALGLMILGIGAGGAYCGAIFYAMDVGDAQVDAGGKHEALLGSGYAAGPIAGLLIQLSGIGGAT